MAAVGGTMRKAVVFAVGSEQYCVPVAKVQRIFIPERITPVPGCEHPACLGVTNLGGQVIPIFDLHRWLGVPKGGRSKNHTLVVMGEDGNLVGLMVDAVLRLADLPLAEETPEVAREGGISPEYVHGVIRDGDQLILHLRVDPFLKAPGQDG